MQSLSIADFADYFEALWGFPPFPWQRRLAEWAWERGRFPGLVDLPTGAGKSSLVDVAVFLLALDGGRRFPRRIVGVVDRRLLVDQTYERARTIASVLEEARSGVLAAVAGRLRALSDDGPPLLVVRLRGGIARDDSWARDPVQPVVVASTVDQVGSRLLFRGYGVSPGARPIHAGLLGNDALLLLDEVHLSEPFRETLEAIERWYGNPPAGAPLDLPRRWQVVQLSATAGHGQEERFQLDERDRGHPELSRRLAARKLVTLHPFQERSSGSRRRDAYVDKLRTLALSQLGEHHRSVAVVVNRVDTARRLYAALGGATFGGSPVDRLLVTGRSRPIERESALQRYVDRIAAGRERQPDAPPLVVVATQAIEVGADYDFDALVTECASLDALAQRLGRLDRRGDLTEAGVEARAAVVVDVKALGEPDPIYGSALEATWKYLLAESSQGGKLDLGPQSPVLRRGLEKAELLAPRRQAPVLLPGHLDLLAQTRPGPHAEPDVSLWLHGIPRAGEQPRPDVQLVWRAELPEELLLERSAAAEEEAVSVVASCRPLAEEAVSVPIDVARAWLQSQSAPDVGDVESLARSAAARRRGGEGTGARVRPVVAWRGDASAVIRRAGEIQPGDTLVLPSTYGGLRDGTWDPESTEAVEDLAEQAWYRQRGRVLIRLHPVFFGELPVPRPVVEDEGSEDALAAAEEAPSPEEQVRTFLDQLRREGWGGSRFQERLEALDVHFQLVTVEAGGERWWVVDGHARRGGEEDLSTADESASFPGRKLGLREHAERVREHLLAYASRLALPRELVELLELAALYHDLGKVDPRFQRMLAEGDVLDAALRRQSGTFLAKSGIPSRDRRRREQARRRAGYPRGARHELLSVALLEEECSVLEGLGEDWKRDLLLHLLASHHGWARPGVPVERDESPEEQVRADFLGRIFEGSTRHGLWSLDAGVGRRFAWALGAFGWWSEAWLEALLRLADQRASAEP